MTPARWRYTVPAFGEGATWVLAERDGTVLAVVDDDGWQAGGQVGRELGHVGRFRAEVALETARVIVPRWQIRGYWPGRRAAWRCATDVLCSPGGEPVGWIGDDGWRAAGRSGTERYDEARECVEAALVEAGVEFDMEAR